MDVRLSDEQRALRDAAASVVAKLGPASVAELDDTTRANRLDAAIAAAGWRDLRTAADDGQPIASAVEAALVAEELGCGHADAAYLGPVLAADLRRLAGGQPSTVAETIGLTPDLAELADGDAAVAVDARGAERVLTSSAGTVISSSVASTLDAEIDLTRRTVGIGDRERGAERVGEATGDGLVRWHALGLALTSADLVGVMRGALDLACEYAATRRQYDAAIGSFQAVQHLLADAHVATEGSRSAALHAAWAVDALDPSDALAAAAAAKAYCARAALSVCETSIQVHGGIGNTWECRAHVYLRRALVSADMFGGVGASLRRVLDHEIGTLEKNGAGVGLR